MRINTRNQIELKDVDHKHFWNIFFAVSYPNSYDNNTELSVSDILEDICTDWDMIWWNDFTRYYEGIFAESNGYLKNPKTLSITWNGTQTLAITFHPGDIAYFLNGAVAML